MRINLTQVFLYASAALLLLSTPLLAEACDYNCEGSEIYVFVLVQDGQVFMESDPYEVERVLGILEPLGEQLRVYPASELLSEILSGKVQYFFGVKHNEDFVGTSDPELVNYLIAKKKDEGVETDDKGVPKNADEGDDEKESGGNGRQPKDGGGPMF